MALIGSLVTNLKANTAHFDKGMRKGKKRLSTFSKSVQSTQRMLKGMAGAMVAYLSVRALKGFIGGAIQTADVTAKVATKLGIAVEELIALQHAAALTGVRAETFNMALQRMIRRLSEAAVGTGEAQGALKELGIDAQAIMRLPIEKQFSLIAEKMKDVKTQGDRVRLSFKLFDSEGVALVTTLMQGAKGLAKIRQEAFDLGLTFTKLEAQQLEKLNDTFYTTLAAVKALGREVALKLMPYLKGAADSIVKMVKHLKGMSAASWEARLKLAAMTVSLIAAIKLAPLVVGAIIGIVKAIKAWTTGQAILLSLAGPMGWATLAAGAAIAVGAYATIKYAFGDMISDIEDGKGALDDIANGLNKTGEAAEQAGQKIKEMLPALKWVDAGNYVEEGLKKRRDTFKKMWKETRTEFEKYKLRIEDLGTMLFEGAIDKDIYGRAIAKAQQALSQWVKGGKAQAQPLATAVMGTGVGAYTMSIPATDPKRDMDRQMLEVEKRHLKVAEQTLKEIRDGKQGSMTGSLGGGL